MHDAVIIGGGPGGLMAACYLGRFRRDTLVIDSGQSRARWIPASHNTPGFPQGVGGEELLRRLRDQALRYGARVQAGEVDALTPLPQGFEVRAAGTRHVGRMVLLGTGVADQLPSLAGAEQAIRRGLLRVCPICDAFEVIDRQIAIIGCGEHALREARFLRTYSASITLLNLGRAPSEFIEQVRDAGAAFMAVRLQELALTDGALTVSVAGSPVKRFEVVYLALGCRPRNKLAVDLGARCDQAGALVVDAHQQTSVPGLYAAGDVVRGLNQIVVAAAEAAEAAADMHRHLR